MKRFLFILLLIVVGIGCLGFYLGWFRLASETTDGKTNITFTVNQEKIKADENKALEKIKGTSQPGTQPTSQEQTPPDGN